MTAEAQYEEINGWNGGLVRAWTQGVQFERSAQQQVHNMAALPFIHSHIAIMPDVHAGIGATVGSVVPTKGAIIPAAVGVDIGCGMMAVRTSLTASDLPDNLSKLRTLIEHAVPHGGAKGNTVGSWNGRSGIPTSILRKWIDSGLEARFKTLCDKYPALKNANSITQLGTLGGGNHFIEVCLDEEQRVWVMLHSGSRGVGNMIGRIFIDKAKEMMLRRDGRKPLDKDLAWLSEGEPEFYDYVEAVAWGQDFARINREMMMVRVLEAMRASGLPPFKTDKEAVNCHHNYVQKEFHFDEWVFVTRKGAVSAQKDQLGIIPGSMGPSPTSCAARATRIRSARARTARADHVADRGQGDLHPGGSDQGHRGRGVPQGRRRDRRNPDGLQGHRRGHGGPEGPRRAGPHPQAGPLRERLGRWPSWTFWRGRRRST
uniref:3'-phosphate/5'-hydroxy nucleic acid ligase n=1 Tax=Caulobacter phage BL57 TaxID=3348355 RepID=A0AB74UKP4_9VIRU